MKIYTRGGDDGTTALFYGGRVRKHDAGPTCYGATDEAVSVIGLARADTEPGSEIFDLLAKFADYGFNKSHAAAYALIAYQTAWFKAHYPAEFLAASMTFDKSQTDKLAEFRDEARRLGIVVEPPSIQRSGVDFDVAPGADGKLEIGRAHV